MRRHDAVAGSSLHRQGIIVTSSSSGHPLMPTIARYGSWKSPITSDLIVAQSISLSETHLDGDTCYWLEGRPQEQGRFVVVSGDAVGSATTDLTPKPFNARTRVHEYGGAPWSVVDGVVYFSNFA